MSNKMRTSRHDHQIVPRRNRSVSPLAPLPSGLRGVDFTLEIVGDTGGGEGDSGYQPVITQAIHHFSFLATTSQLISAGGGKIQWGEDSVAPFERRGFGGISLPTTDLEMSKTGLVIFDLEGFWQSYRGGGDILINRYRPSDGSLAVRAYDGGLVRSRAFGGTGMGMEVEADDVISIELPNDSGDAQILLAAELSMYLHEAIA